MIIFPNNNNNNNNNNNARPLLGLATGCASRKEAYSVGMEAHKFGYRRTESS